MLLYENNIRESDFGLDKDTNVLRFVHIYFIITGIEKRGVPKLHGLILK